MVDRDSERNIGMRMLLHHQRPKWQEIHEKLSSFEATVSRWIIISRPSKGQKEESDQTWRSWLLSRPQAKAEKECNIPGWPAHLQVDSSTETQTQCLNSTSTSHPSHHVQHFSPHSPSSSPPAQLSSREILVSPNAEDHIAPKHQTIIRPQDIDTCSSHLDLQHLFKKPHP